jgi:hypothetical protein
MTYRFEAGAAADKATFLAGDNIVEDTFSTESGEYRWSVASDNTVDEGIESEGLTGVVSQVGNDILSPFAFAGRTTRQVNWLISTLFSNAKSMTATIGFPDQDRNNTIRVFVVTAKWSTSNSRNNRYRDIEISFSNAEELS